MSFVNWELFPYVAQTSQQADYFRSFYQTLPYYTLEITEDLFAGIFFHLII